MSLNYKAKRTGLKGFFLFHSEKVLLILAFVALGAFFFLGYNGQSLDDAKTPEALKSKVEQVKNHILADTWETEAVSPERIVVNDHPDRAKLARVGVQEQYYPNPVLQLPIFRELIKRNDPELFAPEKIEVAVAIGAVAQRVPRGTKWVDPLADAVDPEIEAPKKPKPKRQPRGPYGSEMGSEYGSSEMYGEMGMSPYGSPYGSTQNGKTVKALTPYLQQKFQKEYFTVSGQADLKGAYVVAVKALVPMKRQKDEFERTFKDASGFDPLRDSPEIVWFEAERAEVTNPGMDDGELKWEFITNTELAGEQSRKYATRVEEPADPRYLLNWTTTFPVPPMVMVKLKDLGLHSEVPARRTRGTRPTGPGGERLGPDGKPLPAEGEATTEEETPVERGPRAIRRGPGGGPGGPGAPYGGSPYGGSPYGDAAYGSPYGGSEYGMESGMYGSEYGSEYGMESGMYGSSPYGGSPYGGGMRIADVDYRLVRFFDFKAQPGKIYRYRVRVYYRDPNNVFAIRAGTAVPGAAAAANAAANAAASSGYGSEMSGGESMPSESMPTESYGASGSGYGMSGTGTTDLKEFMLHPDVLTRLAKIDEEQGEGAADETYFRMTEWSAPSSDVVVPFAPEKRFVGDGNEGKRIQLAGGGDFPMGEPNAKFAVSVWDNAKAVDVPVEIDAKRGSVLNKVGPVDVLHPLLLTAGGMGGMSSMGSEGMSMMTPGSGYGESGGNPYEQIDPYADPNAQAAAAPKSPIRRLENYDFKSHSVVLDIRGGDKLPGGDARNPMKSPTLALVVDRFGNLEFASEIQDAEGYRDTLFIDPTPEKVAEEQKKRQEEQAAQAMQGQSQPTGP